MRRRKVDNFRFLLIETGKGEFLFSQDRFRIDGRCLLLLAPGIREIRYESGNAVSYLYVEFSAEDLHMNGPYQECPVGSPHFQTLVELLGSILYEKGKNVSRLISAAIDLTFLEKDRLNHSLIDPRIQRVLKFVDRNLAFPVSVARLSDEAGLSVPQFRRLFREAVHLAPKEYLMRERMQYAKRILRKEGLRVGEVSDLLHFETVFQFSNQYKRIHGHSPVQDRQALP